MKIIKFIIFLFFVPNLSFSQLRGHITNSETGEPVPYVNIWVDGVFIGTTSNSKGEFKFKDSRNNNLLVFSAVGYKTAKVRVESDQLMISLIPSTTELEAVIVGNKNAHIEQKVGTFNKSKINNYFGCGLSPWMAARYFPYKENYESTTFLKEIRIVTDSDVKNAKFIIRLYKASKEREPSEYLFENNIYGYAKKGKSITKIDLSNLFIQFPKKGFFVVVEWLIINENYYEYNSITEDGKKKKRVSYEPSIGLVFNETNPNSWWFSKGLWQLGRMDGGQFLKQTEDSYSMLAIELILSN